MKILVFSPYYPPHIGGLESHADEFNKYLSQKGIDITVFTPRLPKEATEKEIRYNNVKIIRFPAFEIISNYPLPKFWTIKFWQLFLALFKIKFDIVISRTRFFNTSLLALIYAKIKRVKWIHIEHGSDFIQLSSKFKTFIAKLYDYTFGFLIFKFSDINISISQAVSKFIKKFDKRNSPTIYRGMDFEEIDKINPDSEMKKEFERKIIISFAGRLYKWKGVEIGILAIKSLPKEIKEKIVFLIVGDGEDFSTLKKLSEDESCIKMLRNIPREKVIGILKISDIYIHSSFPGGGLSTSLLEAMYCHCAVIATPNEGADEIINHGKNGLLLSKNATNITEEMSEAIKKLIKYPKKINALSNETQKTIQEKFKWGKTINAYEKNFKHQ